MKSDLRAPMSGKIVVVTPSGRAAVILLDTPQQGHKHAIINSETIGRISLINLGNGQFLKDMRVSIIEAECGSEAWRALEVKALLDA